MKTTTHTILKTMKFLSWIVFIILLIQAGILLFAYIYGLINPDATATYVQRFDWMIVKQHSPIGYLIIWISTFTIVCLEAYTTLIVIKILQAINISNPFTLTTAKQLQKVSYLIFIIWIVTIISNACRELFNNKISLGVSLDDMTFILLAGIIYIFAQIFKRGIELQYENEMTI